MSGATASNGNVGSGASETGGGNISDNEPRFIGNKPVLALKRYAHDLDTSSNPDAAKFKEINRNRVENFIKKPYDEINKLHQEYHPSEKSQSKTTFYDYSDTAKHQSLHNLDAPELQRSLGPRSRFGDGDGSFWDKWINTDMPSKGLGVDEKGHPIAGLSEAATLGFKRLYMNRSHASPKSQTTSKPRTRLIVQPYSERKAKRLSEEKEAMTSPQHSSSSATQSTAFPSHLDSNSLSLLSGANWSEVEDTSEIQQTSPVGADSSIQLPPITAVERDAYFGKKARAEFLDMFRQLSRQQNAFKDSQFITNSPTLPSINSAAKSPKKKFIRGKSGRFLGSQEISSDSKSTDRSSPTQSRPGVQSYGKSGILVRTNTSIDADLLESESTESALLKPHLATPHDPGAFGRPLSPRSKFLLGCLSTGVAPRPSLLIRKEVTPTLNLEHQCMGDNGGILLAESLKDLPYLAELNIRDNKLTDVGLTAIIHSLRDCPYLTSLDVSENKIDDEAAAALSSYLTSPECKLVTLVLRRSDVDDNEIGRFIQAISMCETLRDIDLSANLLGSNQNRKPLHPELTSGGQVLGNLLQDRRCKIQSLKLAWNMIRFDSAVALMVSLRSALSLTYLDLSYNGIGQEGAEVLGNSLHYNSTLRSILLSNNNITPRGCFCIFTGIRTNQTLEFIDLSNNPIGERGLHAAMMMITEFGDKITVDLRGCSIRAKDSTCWYDTVRADNLEDYPLNKKIPGVALNLASPYDRAVAIDLLRMAAKSRGRLKLESLKLFNGDPLLDSKGLNGGQSLNLELFATPGAAEYHQAILPSQSLTESLTSLSSPGNIQRLSHDIEKFYLEITKPYERNKKLNVLLTSKLFQKLQIYDHEDTTSSTSKGEDASNPTVTSTSERDDSTGIDWIVYHLFSTYDTNHEGLVTIDEIKNFLIYFIPEYLQKRQNCLNLYNDMMSYKLSSERLHHRYLPPETGYMYCIPTFSYDPLQEFQPTGHNLYSKSHLDNIILSLTHLDNSFHGCEISLLNSALNFSEAWCMYNILLKDLGDKRMIVKKLLPLLSNTYDARLFLYQTIEDDYESRVHLRLTMGSLYKICIGQYTGHYILNFTNFTDRFCFETLWDLNKNSVKNRKQNSLGDTSQYGDFSCFRNITMNSHPIQSFPSDYILSISKNDIIEFDFVSYDNPKTYGFLPLSEHRYHEILKKLDIFPLSHPLMEEEEVITAMGFDDLLRQSFNIEDVQRDEEYFTIPGDSDLPNQFISSHMDGDKILDYMKWCEESLPRRERIPFPKKFSPPKTAKPLSSETRPMLSRGASWKSSAMFSRSYDEYELESPRGSPTQSFSRSVTPRQPQQPSTNPTAAPPLTAELVIETIGYQNISCRQLAFLLYSMSLQDSEMFVDGMRKPYGSTRVEVVIALYNQISDIVNLPCLMKHLTIYERAVLIFRLGWLNIWSPIRPNGIYHLRFHQREERQLIRLLISLSLLETEKEWKSGKLFLSDSENILGGVDLVPNENGCIIPSEWHKEDGIPSKGVLSVEFVSKENEATRLKSHPPLLAYVLPTYLGQEDKLLKKRENITTTHCQFILHNTGVFLDLSAEDGKI